MVIGVLKEIKGNEYRVAAVPATVHEIVRHGHTVYVETGAGVGSGFSDAQYEAAGAIVADTNTVWEKADLYYKVKELFPQEFTPTRRTPCWAATSPPWPMRMCRTRRVSSPCCAP